MILYKFIKYIILYIKYNKILSKVYREEKVIDGLSDLLGVKLQQDWIGRVYAVINPYIKDGKFNPESTVFELGNDNPVYEVVEKYVMERMVIAQQFIHANNLFDLLTYRIKKLDNMGNCLFIMYPAPFEALKIATKRFVWVYGSIIIGLVLFGITLKIA